MNGVLNTPLVAGHEVIESVAVPAARGIGG